MSDYPDTPITREEQYLAAGLDGGDLPDPITREEQYLYEIATKIQGGGGNPNSVTVYETTFGGVPTLIDWQELENNNITAYLTERNTGTGADYKAALYINYDADVNSNNLFAANALQIGSGYPFFLYMEWARTTKIMLVARLVSGEDGSVLFDYQSSTPCTLTIIHHPLPDSE